jgi:hypothetical protein
MPCIDMQDQASIYILPGPKSGSVEERSSLPLEHSSYRLQFDTKLRVAYHYAVGTDLHR